MKIMIRQIGDSKIFWTSRDMTKEEALNTLKILLKPSMFGSKNFDIILKNS